MSIASSIIEFISYSKIRYLIIIINHFLTSKRCVPDNSISNLGGGNLPCFMQVAARRHGALCAPSETFKRVRRFWLQFLLTSKIKALFSSKENSSSNFSKLLLNPALWTCLLLEIAHPMLNPKLRVSSISTESLIQKTYDARSFTLQKDWRSVIL